MWRTPVNVLCLNIFYWISYRFQGLLWPWSYGSWIYNYLCLSPLMLWVRISIRARCTALCDKVCQWLATGRWFSQDPLVSSTNKTDRHDIIKSPKQHLETFCFCSVSSSSSSSSSYYYYYYYYSPPFFLSMAHELAHGRSQELLDRISWNLVEL